MFIWKLKVVYKIIAIFTQKLAFCEQYIFKTSFEYVFIFNWRILAVECYASSCYTT